VRELERRARVSTEPAERRSAAPRAQLHPDQEAAVEQLADAFGSVLGADVRVVPQGGGYRLQLAFESLEEALALADRLAVRDTA
jgi:ParB family chromosome partitioning protein